jgi:ABC-type multidrug transport system ATPase subunit
LLNIIAGRAQSRGPVTIGSEIRLNNYVVDPTNIDVRQMIAFVAQDDSLQVTSTPREAIYFSAKLRLPRSTRDSQLEKLTTRMITELGLTSCADTIVGGALIKGISGGERKRTSVGVELVTKPALVFLDEPTSGLDSFSAVQLCQVLKKVANAGASVLFTNHQPSSAIFNSFDHLILLNKGRVMYQGSVLNVPDYFEKHGYPCPEHFNPADWIMVRGDKNQDLSFLTLLLLLFSKWPSRYLKMNWKRRVSIRTITGRSESRTSQKRTRMHSALPSPGAPLLSWQTELFTTQTLQVS